MCWQFSPILFIQLVIVQFKFLSFSLVICASAMINSWSLCPVLSRFWYFLFYFVALLSCAFGIQFSFPCLFVFVNVRYVSQVSPLCPSHLLCLFIVAVFPLVFIRESLCDSLVWLFQFAAPFWTLCVVSSFGLMLCLLEQLTPACVLYQSANLDQTVTLLYQK